MFSLLTNTTPNKVNTKSKKCKNKVNGRGDRGNIWAGISKSRIERVRVIERGGVENEGKSEGEGEEKRKKREGRKKNRRKKGNRE